MLVPYRINRFVLERLKGGGLAAAQTMLAASGRPAANAVLGVNGGAH